ncbi:MAG: SagB/ThcOx family dehydrogenase [Phycisphaerales bacterium]|nr:MAG: SagB/ThcOx family dehydrogenase [Phycisphaerales bacterium]
MNGIGDQFQEGTKYDVAGTVGGGLNWGKRPSLYKEYGGAPRVALPAFKPSRPASLDQTLRQRQSVRKFGAKALSKGQLSYLLWASTGIQRIEHGYEFRTAPSAGALYPIETYVISNNVKDLPGGIYHYSIRAHQLERLEQGDFGQQISAGALGQGMCASAAVVFAWSAVFERCKWKYDQRAYRYIYLDAGHIGENLALAAVSLNLGSCEIGAFFDEEINRILGVDGTSESVVYMAVVGRPA